MLNRERRWARYDERRLKGYYRTLNYASVNEDWRTEATALQAGPGDAILCVTGSGARPLDLLAQNPARVVAIDLNPAQSALLRLKAVALSRLPFDQYVAFLGLVDAEPAWRLERFADLAAELGPEAELWRSHPGLIERGVIYQGRWELFYRRVARLAGWLRPRAIEALFEFTDLSEQRRFLEEQWDRRYWRATYDLMCSRPFSRLFFGDLAYFQNVSIPVGAYLFHRMKASLGRCLARDNFMVSLVLRGRLTPFDLPPHLTPEGARLIRERLDRLQIVTGDALAMLNEADADASRFTRLSLSDLPSFMTQLQFDRLLGTIGGYCAPGTRFCIRQFLTRQSFCSRFAERLVREPGLEQRLAGEDHAFAYDFIVGRVAS